MDLELSFLVLQDKVAKLAFGLAAVKSVSKNVILTLDIIPIDESEIFLFAGFVF